ncbi:MAG: PQQ-binding-like beta-propeller repeat protein [Planctomycetota bacterium]|nr:PQQ-binding-like beta-propeller repeat protein [Planctomycetota bacterium]
MSRTKIIVSALLLLIGLSNAGRESVADDWGTFRGGSDRTGKTAESLPPPPMDSPPTPQTLVPAWVTPYETGAAVVASPAVNDGNIYVGTYDGTLHCIDALTGNGEWQFPTDGPITTTPTCAGGVVYFTSWDGFLYAVWTEGFDAQGQPRAGEMRWRTFHSGIGGSSPLVVGDTLYVGVGSPSVEIRSYNVATGAQIDSAVTRQPVTSSPAIAGTTVVCGSNDGAMRSFSADLQELHRVDTLGSFGYSGAVVTPFGVVFAPGEEDHSVHVWNPETGAEIAAPYSTGSVAVTQGSNAVTGNGTSWTAAALAGCAFTVAGDPTTYRVASVTSPTSLLLASNYTGVTNPDTAYQIQYLLPYPSNYRPVPAAPGSPAVSGNMIFVQHRLVAGSHLFVLTAVEWNGTQLLHQWRYSVLYAGATVEPTGMCPSPAVSGDYLYTAIANKAMVFQISAPVGPPAGDPPLPAPQIVAEFTTPNLPDGKPDNFHTSPALTNGRVMLATFSGKVYCFRSDNSAPPTPAPLAPVGGVNLDNNNQTITWESVVDPDGQAVTYDIQMLIGSDANLEEHNAPVNSCATNSYSVFVPNDSHVFYRVRARDTMSAASQWSIVEHFWVNQAPPAPAPPTDFHAYPGDQRIFMTWVASPSWTTTGYRVYYRLSVQAPDWPENQSWSFPVAPWAPGQMIEREGFPLQNYVSYDLMLFAVDGNGTLSTGVYKGGVTPAPLVTIGQTSYPTIQAALDAAQPGDTVVLGTHVFDITEPLEVPNGVNVRGQGPQLTTLRGTGNVAAVLRILTGNGTANVWNLGITGSDPVTEGGAQCGIQIEVQEGCTGHVRIHNVLVYGINGHGVDVVRLGPDDPVNPPHIDLLTIVHNHGNGINVSYNGAVRVRNSIIVRNDGWGIFDSNPNPQTVDADYNDVFNNDAGAYSNNVTVGPNGISEDPLFVDEPGNDFRPEQGSPTIDKGDPATEFAAEPNPNGGRVDMGAFGNTEWATQSFVFASVSSGGGGGGGGGGVCFVTTAVEECEPDR